MVPYAKGQKQYDGHIYTPRIMAENLNKGLKGNKLGQKSKRNLASPYNRNTRFTQ